MDELDALVRRVDEDRWLASRFAPAPARTALVAIYALNYEIARTAETVTQEGIGGIRLAWWREAIAEIHAGAPARAHPVLQAYARAAATLPMDEWEGIIAARGKDLDAAPFANWSDLDDYLDATAGALLRLAIAVCAGDQAQHFSRPAALAWGYAGLLRALPFWRARGRSFLAPGVDAAAMIARGRAAYAQARTCALSSAAFPAIGYLTFAPRYFDALARGAESPNLLLLRRQMLLVAASITGKI